MRSLAVSVFCILCCTPFSAFAGIQDIRRMSQNSNEHFNVTCLNGDLETVDAQAIAENLVCKKVSSTSSQRSSVVCTGNEFQDWFYLTRISDGQKFGDMLSLETCLQLSNSKK